MTSFRRRRDVRFRIIDREAVVLRQEAGETLVLNEVGSRILQLVEDGAPLSAIACSIAEEFEVDARQAEGDARAFTDELVEAGILEPADAEAIDSHAGASDAGASDASDARADANLEVATR